jgi:hypothetical protein
MLSSKSVDAHSPARREWVPWSRVRAREFKNPRMGYGLSWSRTRTCADSEPMLG